MRCSTLFVAACVLVTAPMSAASAGTLVASGDEWQLSSYAFQNDYAAGTESFVKSLAATFGGSKYLFLSGNAGVPASQLGAAASQFQALGKTVSYSNTFSLAIAQDYDAVFHFGQLISHADLTTYINGGGNAYVSLGSGQYGNPSSEAAAWNPMLAQFGLVAGSSWFSIAGFEKATITSGPAGATALLWGYGQSIEKLTPQSTSQSYVRGSFVRGPQDIGLIGASTTLRTGVGGVPEPATWGLMILGFGLAGGVLRRRGVLAGA